MGTSSSYGGPKNALEPDWLDDDASVGKAQDDGNGGDVEGTDSIDGNGEDADRPVNNDPVVPALAAIPPQPLGGARGNFTRFTNSGSTKALSGAVSSYTASAGGSRGIVRRMPNSVRTSSSIASLASSFVRDGPVEALRQFNLESLAGRPAIEVFDVLVDELCPEGGTIDEAVARDAFIDAIVIFSEQDIGNFDELTPDQLNEFLAVIMTGCIVSKVINEIGTNSLHGSANNNLYHEAETTLRDYTSGAVRDGLSRSFDSARNMSSARMSELISGIFTDALDILQATLEAEA